MTPVSAIEHACSFLFVPASRPDRLPKALASGADVVIADWEDAVAPAAKPQARDALAGVVAALDGAARIRILVRINAEDTPWFADDLLAAADLVAAGCAGVVVPKADSAEHLQDVVARRLPEGAALLPLIETVAGLAAADRLAAVPQVARLAFGHLDFQVDAGMDCGPEETELLPVRLQLVLASRRAGRPAPVDGVSTDARDQARTQGDAERARRQGFGGKLCIHPAQVAAVHAAFDPDAEAVAWAKRVQEAAARAGGDVCVLDGRMVDAPVVQQAAQVLRRHARAQLRTRA